MNSVLIVFCIVLVEEYSECQNIAQLRKKEREAIEQYKPSLNMNIPSRTKEEWAKDNPEKILDSQRTTRIQETNS